MRADARASQARDSKYIAFRESAKGFAADADMADDGVTSELTGSSPRGEEDTLHACRMLVSALNKAGSQWQDPVVGEGLCDCQAVDRRGNRTMLCVQVVQGSVESKVWKELAHKGKVVQRANVDDAANWMKAAIEHKAGRIQTADRKGLVLAVNAIRLPALRLTAVGENFRSRWCTWTGELGFDSVWLVGPDEDQCWRLDTDEVP
jgi:hypothetical protein